MKIKDEYAKLVAQRENIEHIVDWENEPVIKATIQLFTANLQETIDFLDNDCTADQFSWMSEVFDDISEKLQSWEFIDALRRTAAKFPEETREYNVLSFIETAEGMLSDEVYSQRHPEEKGGDDGVVQP